MRTVETTGAFRRDLKRERKGEHRRIVDSLVAGAVALVRDDKPLPQANKDHSLTGEWSNHRDCHLKPDLVLIYRKPDPDTLQLVRLGSHAELFG